MISTHMKRWSLHHIIPVSDHGNANKNNSTISFYALLLAKKMKSLIISIFREDRSTRFTAG